MVKVEVFAMEYCSRSLRVSCGVGCVNLSSGWEQPGTGLNSRGISPLTTPDERELIAFPYTIASARTQTLQFALMYVLYLGFPVTYVQPLSLHFNHYPLTHPLSIHPAVVPKSRSPSPPPHD